MDSKSTVDMAKTFARDGLRFLNSASCDAALEAFAESARLFAEGGDSAGEAAQRLVIADIQCAMNQPEKALDTCRSVLSILAAREDTTGIAVVLNNIGLLLARLRRYEEAGAAFFDALRAFEVCGKPDRVAEQLGNLGSVCRDRQEYERALDYYHQALHQFDTIGCIDKVADQYANIGYIQVMRGDKDAGRDNFEKARTLYEQAGDAAKARRAVQNIELLKG